VKPGIDPHAVPASRLSRLVRLGSLASGVAGNMLAEGAKQWAQGRRPKIAESRCPDHSFSSELTNQSQPT
jgi:hypothetical protein